MVEVEDSLNLTFAQPWILWLIIPILIALLFFYIRFGRKKIGTLRFSAFQLIEGIPISTGAWKRYLLVAFRLLGISLILVALARPQDRNTRKEVNAEGVDIMLVLDISSSMRAMDFKPNRLEAVKKVADQFVANRLTDRIGLIVFAAESFLKCPLTTDLSRLQGFINDIVIIDEKFDGTAIGLAIASGVNRLRDSQAKSKVMIVLSDGKNNAGELDPITAAQIAKDYNIKIYTIGAGTNGQALMPVKTAMGMQNMRVQVDVDEKTLQNIAETTGGIYFRATNEATLARIYDQISQMEKTQYQVKEYVQYAELFYWPLLAGLLFLSLESILDKTLFRRYP
ncbi:MAG TPA: aerotolerance regulator BatA [Candidatus Marinimicrobia bacterium]|nr:MAG: aerotolerance regulator BatA [Candidatus Marinimicrobia bacterium CG_4_9_14_3_um_filter_48_9]HCW77276.1 aerotolerance regulator BatA [Candidatus Neomarinimicrobiota bacterium]